MGDCSKNVPCRKRATLARMPSRSAGATRSILVKATMPCPIPSKVRMSRCSRVCGMTPSSAATTRITPSIPLAPATMVLMNPSCPGTSTMPTCMSAILQGANPRSIDIPRSFSSLSRSVSQPVSDLTRAVFPWSICPAVPSVMLTCSKAVPPPLATMGTGSVASMKLRSAKQCFWRRCLSPFSPRLSGETVAHPIRPFTGVSTVGGIRPDVHVGLAKPPTAVLSTRLRGSFHLLDPDE